MYKHSGVIKGTLKVAAVLVEAANFVPGAGMVKTAMEAVGEAIDQASINLTLCERLRQQVIACNTGFEMLEKPDVLKPAEQQLQLLLSALKETRDLVKTWGQKRSQLLRLVLAHMDAQDFERCQAALTAAMQVRLCACTAGQYSAIAHCHILTLSTHSTD